MSLTGKVTRATAGTQGFDTDTVVDPHQAQQLRAAGFAFFLRYLSRVEGESSGDLTPTEASSILKAGLALMAVQHLQRGGWVLERSVDGRSVGMSGRCGGYRADIFV